jgi:hypothetical protein
MSDTKLTVTSSRAAVAGFEAVWRTIAQLERAGA